VGLRDGRAVVGLAVGASDGITVGETLGSALGRALVGAVVGSVVGLIVGHVEGRAVAVAVGGTVGRAVGETEGLCVLVGLAVLGVLVGCGDTDGAEVGLLEGFPEGALLGWVEGIALGDTVGLREGIWSETTSVLSEVAMVVLCLVFGKLSETNGTLSTPNMSSPPRVNTEGRWEKDNSLSTEISWACNIVEPLRSTVHVMSSNIAAVVMSVQAMLALWEETVACLMIAPVEASALINDKPRESFCV